jgi:hypothetical protein
MYNKIMKLLYKAEQEGLFYVSTPSFYVPIPRIEMPSVIKCEVVERPKPPLDRTRDKRPREDWVSVVGGCVPGGVR